VSAERRRWVVDSIEEGIAALEEDGDRLVHVPAWLLPGGAKEGIILSLERERTGRDTSVVRITIDDDATRDARRIAKERRRTGGDSRGDIAL
jgi:DUF3006 family protein